VSCTVLQECHVGGSLTGKMVRVHVEIRVTPLIQHTAEHVGR
jgi:hypothetical protein